MMQYAEGVEINLLHCPVYIRDVRNALEWLNKCRS